MSQGIKANISYDSLKKLLQNYTIKECAEILNVSCPTVRRYKDKYNLQVNLDIAKQRNSKKHTKYNCDINYFDKIDTNNKAYLLGFICADGFITDRNEVGIEVSLKDIDIIKFFKSELKSSKEIYVRNGIHPSAGLRIQNNYLVNKIKEYGIVPRKSLILDVSQIIQKANLTLEQISVFLLGYFDGDGCISIAHKKIDNKEYFEMNVTGTLETIQYFKEYFGNKGTVAKRHKDEKNNYTLQISNNYLTIYNALSRLYQYKDTLDFYFQRKYEKFKKLENKVLSLSDKRLKGIEL